MGLEYFPIVGHYRNELRSVVITDTLCVCQGSVITHHFTLNFINGGIFYVITERLIVVILGIVRTTMDEENVG